MEKHGFTTIASNLISGRSRSVWIAKVVAAGILLCGIAAPLSASAVSVPRVAMVSPYVTFAHSEPMAILPTVTASVQSSQKLVPYIPVIVWMSTGVAQSSLPPVSLVISSTGPAAVLQAHPYRMTYAVTREMWNAGRKMAQRTITMRLKLPPQSGEYQITAYINGHVSQYGGPSIVFVDYSHVFRTGTFVENLMKSVGPLTIDVRKVTLTREHVEVEFLQSMKKKSDISQGMLQVYENIPVGAHKTISVPIGGGSWSINHGTYMDTHLFGESIRSQAVSLLLTYRNYPLSATNPGKIGPPFSIVIPLTKVPRHS